MKRFIIGALMVVILPAVCQAEGYVLVNYGIGGDIDEPRLGVEIGGIFLSYLHPTGGALSLGIGISAGDTDEDPPSALLPTAPAPTYDALRDFNDGNEQEVYVSFGAEMVPSFFGVAGLGYASQNTTTIGTSSGQKYLPRNSLPLPLKGTSTCLLSGRIICNSGTSSMSDMVETMNSAGCPFIIGSGTALIK